MMTSRSIFHILIALGFLTLAITVFGSSNENALFIDGKVRTQGISMEGARLVVNRDGIQLNLLSGDISRVEMRLDMGHVYVLSFEREGCMTKEILFDTNLPEEAVEFAPFNFPFLVTLEKREPGTEFRYAQPVGYVRYYPEKQDFGYDTNYTLFRERREKEARMRAAKEKVAWPEDGTKERTSLVVEDSAQTSSVKPKNRSELSATASEVQAPSTTFTRERDAQAMGRTSFMGNSDRAQEKVSTSGTENVTQLRSETPPLPDGRTDELIVEPTYVARVIRITGSGHTREYRRVVHRFGDTYFFCNGSSCGEVTYKTAVDEAP